MKFIPFIYSNSKKIICTISIVMFFLASSSFAFPVFSYENNLGSITEENAVNVSTDYEIAREVVAESEAELAEETKVDEDILKDVGTGVNPDAAEVDSMISVDDILKETDGLKDETVSSEYEGAYEKDETFSRDDWKLILVNKQHPIPDDYTFELGVISGNMKCDERMLEPLMSMLKAARNEGVSLIVCSPYRDINRQTMLFSKKVNMYMEGGMSYMDAYNLASQAVTVPGSSEHQIGLAVDIITKDYITLDEGFGETEAGKWLYKNSAKYGFILRYPKGKESITSIEYEPWHFRYVGVDAAKVITDNNICLEEFWNRYVE